MTGRHSLKKLREFGIGRSHILPEQTDGAANPDPAPADLEADEA